MAHPLNAAAALVAAFALGGCTAERVWAPDDVVARAVYDHPGPASITIYTMVNTETGGGAHTSMMVNASQRVIFDPAGSFSHPAIPERNDVLFGITPRVLDVYRDFYARESYFMIEQSVTVSPEVAEQALALVQAHGAVPEALCTQATTSVLSRLPGFEAVRPALFPKSLSRSFAELPGASYREIHDDDPDENAYVLLALGDYPLTPPSR